MCAFILVVQHLVVQHLALSIWWCTESLVVHRLELPTQLTCTDWLAGSVVVELLWCLSIWWCTEFLVVHRLELPTQMACTNWLAGLVVVELLWWRPKHQQLQTTCRPANRITPIGLRAFERSIAGGFVRLVYLRLAEYMHLYLLVRVEVHPGVLVEVCDCPFGGA